MTVIYHIATREAVLAALNTVPASLRDSGEYCAESFSREGIIHFSGLHQVLDVANRFYAGQRGLVLLEVDVSRLKAELKYEPPVHPLSAGSVQLPKNEDFSRGKRLSSNSNELIEPDSSTDELFPHLYGPLNFDAVIATHDFEPDSTGKFSLPAKLVSTL